MRQAFAGMLWSKQYYAYDVGRWLDGDPVGEPPPAGAATGSQRGLAAFRRRRHPLDARQMGIPVVRGVGPRVPCDHARPRRPVVREVPAARHVPGVVPAPQRRAACVRVVVRRRQPACPCAGGGRGLANRWRAGTCEFLARIFHKLLMNFTWWLNRQDAEGNDLFSGGFLGLDNLSRLRPLAPPGRRPPRAVGRDGMDVRVLHVDAGDGDRARQERSRLHGPPDHLPRAGGPDRRLPQHERPVGRRSTASSTTPCGSPTASRCRSRSTPWSACCRSCRRSSSRAARRSSGPRLASISPASSRRRA